VGNQTKTFPRTPVCTFDLARLLRRLFRFCAVLRATDQVSAGFPYAPLLRMEWGNGCCDGRRMVPQTDSSNTTCLRSSDQAGKVRWLVKPLPYASRQWAKDAALDNARRFWSENRESAAATARARDEPSSHSKRVPGAAPVDEKSMPVSGSSTKRDRPQIRHCLPGWRGRAGVNELQLRRRRTGARVLAKGGPIARGQ